jgi:chemotaxis protein histidine kinase CheA
LLVDDRIRMKEQLATIGERYLRRTLGELARLKELHAQVHSGSQQALKDLEVIVHRVHGSGAMFGFDEVSEHAHSCEILCAEAAADPLLAPKLEAALHALETSLLCAARARGIEV